MVKVMRTMLTTLGILLIGISQSAIANSEAKEMAYCWGATHFYFVLASKSDASKKAYVDVYKSEVIKEKAALKLQTSAKDWEIWVDSAFMDFQLKLNNATNNNQTLMDAYPQDMVKLQSCIVSTGQFINDL